MTISLSIQLSSVRQWNDHFLKKILSLRFFPPNRVPQPQVKHHQSGRASHNPTKRKRIKCLEKWRWRIENGFWLRLKLIMLFACSTSPSLRLHQIFITNRRTVDALHSPAITAHPKYSTDQPQYYGRPSVVPAPPCSSYTKITGLGMRDLKYALHY